MIQPELIPKYVREILLRFESLGFEAYIVGGCTRDLLLGKRPHDWDICTSALPNEIIASFRHTVPTGIKHGTVTVIRGKKPFEVTTFRSDGDYSDHRRPESVCFVKTLENDLARRDFTMNAIACDAGGNLHDPFGGIADIERGVIQCVGNDEKRFDEDALRMLRAYRFSAQLGFSIADKTKLAIAKKSGNVSALSAERVRDELIKTLMSPFPENAFAMLDAKLLSNYFTPQNSYPGAEKLKNLPKNISARFFVFCEILNENSADAAKKLRFPNETIKTLQSAASHPFFARNSEECRRLLSKAGRAASLCSASRAYIEGNKIALSLLRKTLKEGGCCTLSELAVSGWDLQPLCISGKEIGESLDFLLDYVITHPDKNNREILLDVLQNAKKI